jgi:glutamate racemase
MSQPCPIKKKSSSTIGIFDSGLGGLTVLKKLLVQLPDYNYLYLGDNARVPYGNKTQALIFEYTRQAVDYLFRHGCQLVIIACNTASSQALRRLQQTWLPQNYPDRKILGVIKPLAEAAAKHEPDKRIGIIGTEATIRSGAYEREIKAINPRLKIISQSAPLLVPLIEEGWTDQPETIKILNAYLKPLTEKKIDTLILACTHYPFLQNKIKKNIGAKIWVPDTGELIALSLKDYLNRHKELKIIKTKHPALKFLTTDNPDRFIKLGGKFLGRVINDVSKINL